MNKIVSILTVAILLGFSACQKKYDTPPISTLNEGTVITLDSLISMYKGLPLKITEDISVYATVTMDETDGNIYKNIYVEDSTAAIQIRTIAGGGMYAGDYIRIAMKGAILSSFQDRMQIDSVDTDVNLIKVEAGKFLTPQTVAIWDLLQDPWKYESRFIRLEGVQFMTNQLGQTYANSENREEGLINITDCTGIEATVSSSGYANFADELVAEGRGSMNCIVVPGNNNSFVLGIQSFEDLKLTGERCDDGTYKSVFRKDFEDGELESDGWTTQVPVGQVTWEISNFGNFAQISNFVGGSNFASEAWLISPSYNLSSVDNPLLQFDNAYRYGGPPLEVYVSTDFTGGPLENATWTQLFPTLSPGDFIWTDSRALDLNAYKGSNVHVAFKYSGSDTDGSTWEVDNIIIGTR